MLARIVCDGVFLSLSVVLCLSLSPGGGRAELGCGAAFGRGARSEMSEHGKNSQGEEDEARAYAHLLSAFWRANRGCVCVQEGRPSI